MSLRRPRSMYCSPGERDAIQERAAAAGQPVSRFVMERALSGEEAGRAAALTVEERAELHDGVRRLVALAGVLRSAAGDGGDMHLPAGAEERE